MKTTFLFTHSMKKLDAFRTTEELEENPYPENIQTVYNYWLEPDGLHNGDHVDQNEAEYWAYDGSAFLEATADFYRYII